MYSFSGNCVASVPISTFMCLWAIHIFSGSVHIFPAAEKADRSWQYIYKSLTDTRMWILGLWLRNSFSAKICFEFSALVLCSECQMLYVLLALSLKRRVFTVHGRVARPKSTSYLINTIKAPTFATVRPWIRRCSNKGTYSRDYCITNSNRQGLLYFPVTCSLIKRFIHTFTSNNTKKCEYKKPCLS
jgi:hypothetical protein